MKIGREIVLFLIVILASVGVGIGAYKYHESIDKNEVIVPQDITLSYQELKEIMKNVPIESYFNYNPYIEDAMLENMGERLLIALALDRADSVLCEDASMCGSDGSKKSQALDKAASKYFNINYINGFLKEMYNYEIKKISPTSTWSDVYNSASGIYTYEDGFFLKVDEVEQNNDIKNWGLLTAYGSLGEDLVIQEYACYGDKKEYALIDYRTKKILEINFDYFNQFHEYSNNFFIENRKEFTKYEHIFKKNESGYYWYSTKVLED